MPVNTSCFTRCKLFWLILTKHQICNKRRTKTAKKQIHLIVICMTLHSCGGVLYDYFGKKVMIRIIAKVYCDIRLRYTYELRDQ